ncbi:hypothetical protein ACFY9N_11600 [Microbacterium sp. NPDC008134]|uniref:hypothetical protein n=1 Tax=Microbacterium sp. NPDC008134 TaxID=3364183 RepID=UPI0036EF916B
MTDTAIEVSPPVNAPRTDSTPLPMGRTRVSRAAMGATLAIAAASLAIVGMGSAYLIAGAP